MVWKIYIKATEIKMEEMLVKNNDNKRNQYYRVVKCLVIN